MEDDKKKPIFTPTPFEASLSARSDPVETKSRKMWGFTSKWTKWIVVVGVIYILYFLAINFLA